MASKEAPTILLVHGGGYGNAVYWERLETGLHAAGFATVAGTNPSNGLATVRTGHVFQDDVLYWREKIETLADAGKDIVILMHSLGSVVAIEAAQGLTKADREKCGRSGGVSHMVFLAAYLPDEGESVFTFYGTRGSLPSRASFTEANGTSVFDLAPFYEHYYSDCPATEREHWKQYMALQATEVLTQPITHATWKDVPCTWVFTEQDEIVTLEAQQMMVQYAKEKYGVTFQTFSVVTGHSPFLSKPDEIVEIIQAVCKENHP